MFSNFSGLALQLRGGAAAAAAAAVLQQQPGHLRGAPRQPDHQRVPRDQKRPRTDPRWESVDSAGPTVYICVYKVKYIYKRTFMYIQIFFIV